jgi:cation:H+ antiporter
MHDGQIHDGLVLLAGIVLAGLGGELFLRGLLGIARRARVSAAVVAATVAAFATSSPELSVGLGAALAGRPLISLGDTLGSNVVNVALILGVGLLLAGIPASRAAVKREFPVALSVPLLLGLLSFDGRLSRSDGAVLLAAFFAWLASVLLEARRQRSSREDAAEAARGWGGPVLAAAGLALLIAAGRLVVSGATGLALSLGLPAFVIGATIVAVGTSVPELATTLVSQLRGHHDVGLGTILGSNIFNGLFIVGAVALICPFDVAGRQIATALGFGIAAVVLTWPPRDGFITRRRGLALVALYGVYLFALLRS